MIYRVTLPLPPSVNGSLMPVHRGYLPNKKPRVILAPTKAMEDWKEAARGVLADVGRAPLSGPVEFYAEFFLPSLASDCSNRLKAVEDVLSGWAYEDDKQVVEDHAFKRIAGSEAEQRVVVVVRPADPVEHADVARRLEESWKRAVREAAKATGAGRQAALPLAAPAEEPAPWDEPEVGGEPEADTNEIRLQAASAPRHYVGDACPGGHERLAGARLSNLGPRREETAQERIRRLATPATYGGGR